MTKPDYGQDAPGLVRAFVGASSALGCAWLLLFLFAAGTAWGIALTALAAVGTLYFSGMGALMIAWSRVVKVRGRDKLLDAISWTGHETVLDVGCGRGLLLVGAAKRLTTGRATGLDLWSQADQGSNSPDATIENARREGVAERVEVVTGDMRELPFAEEKFDVIVSHWAVHNVPTPAGRAQALAEMERVLKPGGYAVIADIQFEAEYRGRLLALGFRPVVATHSAPVANLLALVSFGSFRPTALVARKSGA